MLMPIFCTLKCLSTKMLFTCKMSYYVRTSDTFQYIQKYTKHETDYLITHVLIEECDMRGKIVCKTERWILRDKASNSFKLLIQVSV